MFIKHDYSYIGDAENKLIEKGLAELDVFSITFDRYYTKEEQAGNKVLAESISKEDWSIHCENIRLELANKIKPIIDMLNLKYDIHQYEENKSTMDHFKSNWDLYFGCGCNTNNTRDYSYVKLNFNDKRTVQENIILLNKVNDLIKSIDVNGIGCRVQYTTRKHQLQIDQLAITICEKLLNTFINYNGMIGKIKIINEQEGQKYYGFFKKGSRNRYYSVNNDSLILQFG